MSQRKEVVRIGVRGWLAWIRKDALTDELFAPLGMSELGSLPRQQDPQDAKAS